MSKLLLGDLTAASYNPRKITDTQLAALRKSMETFGDLSGIVFNRRTGNLVGGHQRLKHLPQSLEITIIQKFDEPNPQGTVSIGYVDWRGERWSFREIDVDRQTEVAMNIAANQHGGEFELPTLFELVTELAAEDFEMDLLGFDEKELREMIVSANDDIDSGKADEVPEPPAEPITKAGDLWALGDHRLLCGDSTNTKDVQRLMDGARADLLLTDPPYNVDYTGKTKEALKVTNDSMADGDFRQFLTSCFVSAFEVMKPGAAFYVFHADSEGYNFRGAIHDCDQKIRQCLVWIKDTLVMGRQDYQWQHEPCLYGWKDGAAHGWYSDRKQTTLLRFNRPTRSQDHPTMKPVAMFAYLMGNSTAPSGLAYDPFLGSGTTLIAAEELGRKCYGMEISPQYCDVIVKRWEEFTGKKAKLVENSNATTT